MIKQKIGVFGNGYMGNYLKKLNERHYDIYTFSKGNDAYNDPSCFLNILEKFKFDYIINACGYTGRPNVDECEKNKAKCWELNVSLPVMMATICKTVDIPFIHISSGCVYTGYDKVYSENDTPNFGLGNKESSWYSKTKHAAEIAMKNTNSYIFRIRMPFDSTDNERNFLSKILKYDNLIDYKNSMTCVEDFVNFTEKFIDMLRIELNSLPWNRKIKPGIYNVCNPGSVSIKNVVSLFKKHGLGNSKWKFVDIEKLDLKANRSNCELDCDKIKKLNLNLPPVEDSLEKCVQSLTDSMLEQLNER